MSDDSLAIEIDWPVPCAHFRIRCKGWKSILAMPLPSQMIPWCDLEVLGLGYVLRLASEAPAYDPTPLKLLPEVGLQDLADGDPPSDPEAEAAKIEMAAEMLLNVLPKSGVVVHCVGGRGRTGTVIGRALCLAGIASPTRVSDTLNEAYRRVGKGGWPEAEWQHDVLKGVE